MKIYLILIIVSVLLTVTGLLNDGMYIETIQERAQLWEKQMKGNELGFPLDFVIQGPSNFDPPLPYKFGFNFNDIREILWGNFVLNILIFYILLLVITFVFKKIIKGKLLN